jgi:hypothetical protein
MLCLHDRIRDDDPLLPRLLNAVEDAYSLTEVILAAWQVARVLTVRLVEAVLAERAVVHSPGPAAQHAGSHCGVRVLPRARSRAAFIR